MSADARVAGTYIEVDQATLYVEDRGVGAPIILIHGGLASSASWEHMLPRLIDEFRVIVPDSRGHGRSTNASGKLSYVQLADDIAALIAAMDLDRPVVGGYSDGGQIALELGARHPEAASGLIVGAAYPEFADSGLRDVFRMVLGADDANRPDLVKLDAVLGEAADLVKSWHPGGERQWRTLVELTAPMWLDYKGLTNDDLRAIDVPVLVYTGDRDGLIALDLMVALYRAMPNAELAVCPGTDHLGAMMPERAGLFAELIRDFAVRHSAAR